LYLTRAFRKAKKLARIYGKLLKSLVMRGRLEVNIISRSWVRNSALMTIFSFYSYEFLIFGFGDGIFKVVQEIAEGEDELMEHMKSLFGVDLVAFLEHPGIYFDDLFFGGGHIFDGDESQYVFALLGDRRVDFHRVEEIAFVEGLAEEGQQHGVVAADSGRQHLIELEEVI